MSVNPKLEFFRFKLKPRHGSTKKTFKDFAIDELKGRYGDQTSTTFKRLFEHFIEQLTGKYASDDKLLKELRLERKNNMHYDKRPQQKEEDNIVHGVINGGAFGRDRILADRIEKEKSSALGQTTLILGYFYFMLYLPVDNDEGFIIIHSNSKDESITPLFKKFITKIFKGKNYLTPDPEAFCPVEFQNEFKKGAVLKSVVFQTTVIEDPYSKSGASELLPGYDIKIEAIPKNKNIHPSSIGKIVNQIKDYVFERNGNGKTLNEFEKTTVHTKGKNGQGEKIFELQHLDDEFVPVVYLKDRVLKKNVDGTPDFTELSEYCLDVFKTKILKEIRPDLTNVKRIGNIS